MSGLRLNKMPQDMGIATRSDSEWDGARPGEPGCGSWGGGVPGTDAELPLEAEV